MQLKKDIDLFDVEKMWLNTICLLLIWFLYLYASVGTGQLCKLDTAPIIHIP